MPTPTSLANKLGAQSIVLCLAFGLATSGTAAAQSQLVDQDDLDALYRTPADGGVRRWRVGADSLEMFKSRSPGASVVVTLKAGAVLSNMGCTRDKDTLWCSVRHFRGGPKGFVLANGLEPATGPDGLVPFGRDDSRRRAGKRDFDAKGDVPCAQEKGQSLGTCGIAVARGDGGDATAVVTFPNGFSRKLYFVHRQFVSASATMSGVGRDTDWRLKDGTHMIRVDDQRFEIPDALVYGD